MTFIGMEYNIHSSGYNVIHRLTNWWYFVMVGSTSRSLLRCKAVLGSAEEDMFRPWTPRMTSTQGQDASAAAHHREGEEGGGGRGGEEEGGGRWTEVV